ncbi:MAG: cytochrome bd ubiquinol oxidase subunit [Baekduia sp.]|nr:cytochrome bd ubiquinol oxidase subunit [Baekduia sp.]
MSLAEIPMLFVLAGLVFYIVLAGADFGAALWQISAPRTREGERLRALAHDVMAPVWEANHVWLIFVLTVTWTAYPAAFGSMASTLALPLSIAAFGIIVRGAAYALSSGTSDPREIRRIDAASAISSVLAPFALGACVGALASGRVPYGNAAGDLWSSWLNPTSILIGVLAVVISAYLAAVYLCADAVRHGVTDIAEGYRRRALASGMVAGLLAIAGLVVLHGDAHPLYHELVAGNGLPALILSVLAGAVTLLLVVRRRFEPARYTAALAVTAIVAGWALAQQPQFLPGLTIDQAAAPHDTLVAVIVAVVGGAIILFPSLALLLRLTLGGHLGHAAQVGVEEDHDEGHGGGEGRETAVEPWGRAPSGPALPVAEGLAARVAGACLVGGLGLLTAAETGWAHAVGVVLLLAFVVAGFLATVPAFLDAEPQT